MTLTPERSYHFTRTLGKLICAWPPDPKTGRTERFLNNAFWTVYVVNAVLLMIPLAFAIRYFRDDVTTVTKAVSELTSLEEVVLNLIICRVQRARLQELTSEIRNFMTKAQPHEKSVLQMYVARYTPFNVFLASSYILTAITFCCVPLLTSRTLPADAWYPFSTDRIFVRCVVYLHQSLAVLHCGMCIGIDITTVTLFWYAGARLEMLETEFREFDTKADLHRCIKKHQHVIRYVSETSRAHGLIIAKVPMTMTIAVACGGIQLIRRESLLVMSQFVFYVMAAALRLFAFAWAADNLKETSERLALAIYESDWMNKSSKIQKDLRIMIQRCQRPLVIRISGVLPLLSLNYYVQFLSTCFSYFMTLLAVTA